MSGLELHFGKMRTFWGWGGECHTEIERALQPGRRGRCEFHTPHLHKDPRIRAAMVGDRTTGSGHRAQGRSESEPSCWEPRGTGPRSLAQQPPTEQRATGPRGQRGVVPTHHAGPAGQGPSGQLSWFLLQIASLLKNNERIQSTQTVTPIDEDSDIKKIKKVCPIPPGCTPAPASCVPAPGRGPLTSAPETKPEPRSSHLL